MSTAAPPVGETPAADKPAAPAHRRTDTPPPVTGWGVIALLMLYLMAATCTLLYVLAQMLPSPPANGAPVPVFLFAWTIQPSDEVRLFWLVTLSGALGGLVHTLRSFYWYIGNQKLMRHWLPMYFLLPFVGASISLIFYLVIRGGFFSPQSSVSQTSPFGFVALAGMIGMFSPQAVLKLQQVAEVVLTKPESGADASPQQTTHGAAPTNGTNNTGAAPRIGSPMEAITVVKRPTDDPNA